MHTMAHNVIPLSFVDAFAAKCAHSPSADVAQGDLRRTQFCKWVYYTGSALLHYTKCCVLPSWPLGKHYLVAPFIIILITLKMIPNTTYVMSLLHLLKSSDLSGWYRIAGNARGRVVFAKVQNWAQTVIYLRTFSRFHDEDKPHPLYDGDYMHSAGWPGNNLERNVW